MQPPSLIHCRPPLPEPRPEFPVVPEVQLFLLATFFFWPPPLWLIGAFISDQAIWVCLVHSHIRWISSTADLCSLPYLLVVCWDYLASHCVDCQVESFTCTLKG